jgi:hypothetical protein
VTQPATHAGRTFDWVPRFDERSRGFAVAAGADLPATGVLWKPGRTLDQGAEGACCGFAAAHEAAAEPVPVPRVTNSYARGWYRMAQRRDQWAGENYSGTSVLATCLEGRARGLYTGFRWSFSAEELAAGLPQGPAIAGVEWTQGSYETNALGVLEPSGAVVGGHAICVLGFIPSVDLLAEDARRLLEDLDLLAGLESLDEPAFIVLNSWGEDWGKKGLAIVSLTTVRGWVRAGAEFAHPEGRRLPGRKGTAVSEAEDVAGVEDERPDDADPGTQEPGDNGGAEPIQPASHVIHVAVTELQEGDRIFLPGWAEDLLGQEKVLRSGPAQVARVETRAGAFFLPAGDQVKVRRATSDGA